MYICLLRLFVVGERARSSRQEGITPLPVDCFCFRLPCNEGSFPDHYPLLHPSPLELVLPSPPVSRLSCTSVDGARLCVDGGTTPWLYVVGYQPFGARTHSCRSAVEGEGALTPMALDGSDGLRSREWLRRWKGRCSEVTTSDGDGDC